eukprot:Skav204939  [mRNA]  locus=scaffold2911:12545:13276:- [translate_table: standard]
MCRETSCSQSLKTMATTQACGRGLYCRPHPPQCISLLARHSAILLQTDILVDEVTAVMHPFNEFDLTAVRHLLSVVELGMLTELKQALKSRTNPNHSYRGNTPLAVAILDRHRDEDESTELLVETLLEAKALPQTDDKPNHANLLHITIRSSLCEFERIAILHMLCEAGASIDHMDDHSYTRPSIRLLTMVTWRWFGVFFTGRPTLISAPLCKNTLECPIMKSESNCGTGKRLRFITRVGEAI